MVPTSDGTSVLRGSYRRPGRSLRFDWTPSTRGALELIKYKELRPRLHVESAIEPCLLTVGGGVVQGSRRLVH